MFCIPREMENGKHPISRDSRTLTKLKIEKLLNYGCKSCCKREHNEDQYNSFTSTTLCPAYLFSIRRKITIFKKLLWGRAISILGNYGVLL